MTSLAAALFLTTGWTAAWYMWMFQAEIRHAIIYRWFPEEWLGGVDIDDVMLMDNDELSTFIAASEAPAFLRGLLVCPRCVSAYTSLVGTLMVLPLIDSLLLAPLVWASSAFFSNFLNSTHK